MRGVLDTNTVVSALVWGGTPYALIAAATEERLELYSSPALLEELADVLGERSSPLAWNVRSARWLSSSSSIVAWWNW